MHTKPSHQDGCCSAMSPLRNFKSTRCLSPIVLHKEKLQRTKTAQNWSLLGALQSTGQHKMIQKGSSRQRKEVKDLDEAKTNVSKVTRPAQCRLFLTQWGFCPISSLHWGPW